MPIAAATMQSVILDSSANVLAQLIRLSRGEKSARGNAGFEVLEVLRFCIFSMIMSPPNWLWQVWLEKKFPGYITPTSSHYLATEIPLDPADEPARLTTWRDGKLSYKNLAIKLILDCITVGALVNVIGFLIIMGALRGLNLTQILQSIARNTIALLVASYYVWPLASIVAYCYISSEKRIVFLSVVGLCWGVYLSLVHLDV